MNKNLNLMDILKDCPKGYKLYSTIYGEVEFVEIINNYITKDPIIYKYKDNDGNYYVGSTTIDGKFTKFPDGECTLFPEKHQRDWSKFRVEPEMVDGEFYYCDYKGRKYIFIYKEKEDLYKTNNYAIIRINESPYVLKQNAPIYCGYLAYFDELRKASEKEKQILLSVIDRNQLKWDADKKKLVEKEIELVDSEIYYARTDLSEWIYMYKRNDKFKTNHYVALMNGDFLLFDHICTTHAEDIKVLRKATEEEKRLLHYSIGKKGLTFNEDTKELMAVKPELVDGEIYYAKTKSAEWIYIYKKNYTYETNHHAAVLNNYLFEFNNICTTHNEDIKILRKATEEEKRMLFKIIEENGRKWDEEKKELVKIESEMIDGEFYYCSLFNTVNDSIYIYRKSKGYKTEYYVKLDLFDLELFENCIITTNEENIKLRKATDEEKEMFFNILQKNGYKWDEEKKTLEEISVPHTPEKFYIRIGEIPSNEKSKVYRGDVVVGYENGVSVYDCIETDGLYRIVMPFPLKEGQGMTYECLIQEITQCRYEIENPRNVYLVSGMEVGKGHDNEPLIKDVKILKDLTEQFNTKSYNTEETKTLEELTVPKFKVGDFKLVLDKFDINTLQPFDKILCRVDNSSKWRCELFSHFCDICYKFFCSGGLYTQCIPYNEETKHLVGKNEKPPKEYITWEE